MNSDILKVGLAASGVVSGYFLYKKCTSGVKLSSLRELAEEEIPEDLDIVCIDAMAKYDDAKVKADKVRMAIKQIKDKEKIALGYSTAKSEEKSAKDAFEAAKKALKNFKPDSTQVVAGTGENAVAVNIQNSGAKTALELAVKDAQSKYDQARARRELLDDTIANNVNKSLTTEQTDIITKENQAYNAYQKALKERDEAITDICNNAEWKRSKTAALFKKTTTKGDVITEAVGLSALPVAALCYIWVDAANKIKLLEG